MYKEKHIIYPFYLNKSEEEIRIRLSWIKMIMGVGNFMKRPNVIKQHKKFKFVRKRRDIAG